jgi:transposase
MMGNVTTIGLDIAKSVFQVHGVDAAGEIVVRRKLTRGRVLAFFESLPRCLAEPKPAVRRIIGRES